MPLYVGDYTGDTLHLTTLQHGIYFLLIIAYWRRGGPLPDNDDYLSGVSKLSLAEWQAHKPTLQAFFNVIGGLWRHKRIDAELAKASRMQQVLQAKALKGVQARRKLGQLPKEPQVEPQVEPGDEPLVNHRRTPSPSPSPSHNGKKEQEVREPIKELPAHLNTARMQNRWQVWQTHRRAHKKPKSWLALFNEQIEWLAKYDEPTAYEILSASIRNGWQGLFEPKTYGNRTSSPASQQNPRNIGVTVGPTNYGDAARRLLERQAAGTAPPLVGQMGKAEPDPPPTDCSPERGLELLRELRKAAE